jgi:hypothetical protein
MEARMRNLFRGGAVFFILAGISFLVVALEYLMTDSGSPGSSGALVATGVVWVGHWARDQKKEHQMSERRVVAVDPEAYLQAVGSFTAGLKA